MSIVLLWHSLAGGQCALDSREVASKLQNLFAPLFRRPLEQRIIQSPTLQMVVLELPARGWRPPFFQEDQETWAFAADYPINGRTVLVAAGMHFSEENFLPAFCRSLQCNPRSLLKDLAPPFSLIWSSKATGEAFIQNDGLGQTQLFEFQDGNLWALTNKIFAFKALGVSLEPQPEQWAVWATLGWFPMEMSGYRNIQFLQPATQLRITAQSIRPTRHNVLTDWVHPEKRSPSDYLELARCSLLNMINGCAPLWQKPSAGLSGGWDSRAVVASLRKAGVDFSARVRGLPNSHDVVIATELARIAGLNLKVQETGVLPPDDPDACRRAIELALLWQAGHLNGYRHKTFLANQPNLEPWSVNVTGQHGEIGRRERMISDDYQPKPIPSALSSNSQYEHHIVGELRKDLPAFLRPGLRDFVEETIRRSFRQADRHGLTGLASVDFFGLYEFTRRKGSAVHAYQARQLVAPFLNPDYIRAVFGYLDRKDANAFPRYIVEVNSPEWVGVPYYEDLERQKVESGGANLLHGVANPPPSPPGRGAGGVGLSNWKQPSGRRHYDGAGYWQSAGKPLIDEALAHDGWWREVFDQNRAKIQWLSNPDALVILRLLPGALNRPSL